jgi:ABC-type protease/lipase transport system fused ATPase/permease subunit
MLVESLSKLNETRENSNNFWMGANAVGISALSYLRDSQNISQSHKSFLFLTIVILGIFFCLTWLNYLWTIRESLETRNKLLVGLEKNFSIPLFSNIYLLSHKQSVRASLTLKEMTVPFLFLTSYGFFIFILFFFPQEVVPS